jgi:hypothetical protein
VIGKRPFLAVLALALPLAPLSLAAQLLPAGPEQRADSRLDLSPSCPHLAATAHGTFEIAWDYDGLGDRFAYGRHFDPAGVLTDLEQTPLGPSGSSHDFNGVDLITSLGDGFQIFITKFDPTGKRPPVDYRQQIDGNGDVGPPERLQIGTVPVVGPEGSLYTPFYQTLQKNLAIQEVTAGGTLQGRRIVLTSRPIGQPSFPQLAPQHGVNFVVAWSGLSVGERPRQVLRARVVRQGRPFGPGDFDVNTLPGGLANKAPHLGAPIVTADPSTGAFAAVWTVGDAAGNTSIHLRFFDPSARPLSPETVAVPDAKPVSLVSAALDDAGHLLLLWRPPHGNVLRARLFAAAGGAPVGAPFPLNTVADHQSCGSAAWAGDSWLITWLEPGDGGRNAVVWRRFTE